jgi:hypothetical protein
MTVYVDDACIQATVLNGSRRYSSQWSHLIADTEQELHEFAVRLGLRRAWFQVAKPLGRRPVDPTSVRAQMWHYDLTAPKRARAIRLGAESITTRQTMQIIRARHARLFP